MSITTNINSVENVGFPNIKIIDNMIVCDKGIIKDIDVYELYGREVAKFAKVNSKTLELNDLKGAYIIRVVTDKTIETIKHFSN